MQENTGMYVAIYSKHWIDVTKSKRRQPKTKII